MRAAWGQSVASMRDDLQPGWPTLIDVRAQHPATLFMLARALLHVQHTDTAGLRILRDVQSAHPEDRQLNVALGYVLHNQKDYEERLFASTPRP